MYRPPETPLLTEAFLSGLPDDEAVFLADDELDQPPPGCDAIAGDAGDDLVPSPDEMIAGAP